MAGDIYYTDQMLLSYQFFNQEEYQYRWFTAASCELDIYFIVFSIMEKCIVVSGGSSVRFTLILKIQDLRHLL